MFKSRLFHWMAAAAAVVAISLVAVAQGQGGQGKSKGKGKAAVTVAVPLGLLPIVWPADNLYNPAKGELGRILYFERRLSGDATVSCASCHAPNHGFTDGFPVSVGIRGQKGGRSAPTVINRAYSEAQFWDGRAASLEDQAVGPIQNPIEMGETHANMVVKLTGITGYAPMFKEAFGTPEITVDRVGKAIATFERTLLSGNSAYDRYKAGNRSALNASQIRGMKVYFDKAKCDQCHEGINFTTNSYANLGVGMDKADPDPGRMAVTKAEEDWGRFKTPTLRDITKTAPYMHDGSLKTLEEVVDFYNDGGKANRNLDVRMVKLKLTDTDKADLVAFLKALDGDPIKVTVPTAFPQSKM